MESHGFSDHLNVLRQSALLLIEEDSKGAEKVLAATVKIVNFTR
jgi:hypothetical protein